MNKQDWNYIAPPRSRLPRGYEEMPVIQQRVRWWLLVWALLGLAFWYGVYWVATR